LIETPAEKPGWKERVPGTATRATFPGSAVEFENLFFEVRKVEFDPAGRYRYYLSAWDNCYPIRTPITYSVETCLRTAREQKSDRKQNLVRAFFPLLAPLAGLLPAAMQRSIENNVGFPATLMTTLSAFLLLLPACSPPCAPCSFFSALSCCLRCWLHCSLSACTFFSNPLSASPPLSTPANRWALR